MNLSERATIAQADQTLAADRIVVHFNDDDQGAQFIEMHGHARVTPRAARPTARRTCGRRDALEFQPDGQTLRHATLTKRARVRRRRSGHTDDLGRGYRSRRGRRRPDADESRCQGQRRGPAAGERPRPDRTIHAATLVASGEAGGAEERGVRRRRDVRGEAAARPAAAAGRRRGRQSDGDLGLARARPQGPARRDSTAEFRKNVSFKDGEMEAGADLAVHDETRGTLVLTPAACAKPAWVDDGPSASTPLDPGRDGLA